MLRKLSLWAFLAIAVAVVFATLSPIELRPKTGHVFLERFFAYAALGATLTLAYPKRWLISLIALCAFAIGLEVLQTLEPGRHGRVSDGLQKVLGAAAGVALALSSRVFSGLDPGQAHISL